MQARVFTCRLAPDERAVPTAVDPRASPEDVVARAGMMTTVALRKTHNPPPARASCLGSIDSLLGEFREPGSRLSVRPRFSGAPIPALPLASAAADIAGRLERGGPGGVLGALPPPPAAAAAPGRPPVAWASVRRFASPCRRRPLRRPAMPGLRLPEVPARLRLLERPASRRCRWRARIGSPRPIRRSGRPARICLRSIPYRLMTSSRIRSRKCAKCRRRFMWPGRM